MCVMVEPGYILDKYELLEKVGQGGMAVVYRGLDRSLKREVAVKVLHTHLAEHQEARDRFEREAHAVAKLRHDNILAIYDYSGSSSAQSYIVTEFIRGQTLKELITARRLAYPEVGAMVCAEVCRALAHAHSLGILHRDVKPENIMIRDDGLIKLMDFGIAQMLDTQRLTVTGQLLGSPAYMSPEHVQGGDLDVRTDVFAVGIVLYQLVTGELPFRGRNPHEILKRIADGEYEPPEALQPRVGRELGDILRRTLARDKQARYADITQLRGALNDYLEGSGLGDARAELARFFASPSSYEIALAERLVAHLAARGHDALGDNRAAALELYNRVLVIDADNEPVLAAIERLSRRRRGARIAGLFGGVVALSALAIGARAWLAQPGPPTPPAALPTAAPAPASAPPARNASSARAVVTATPPAVIADAASAQVVAATAPPEPPAPRARASSARLAARGHQTTAARPEPTELVGAEAGARTFALTVFPPSSDYRVDDGEWLPYPRRAVELALGEGAHRVAVRNECCQTTERVIAPGAGGGELNITAPFKPGTLTARCETAGASVQFDGKPVPLGRPRPILIRSATGAEQVQVLFIVDGRSIETIARVRFNEQVEVSCD